MNLNEFLLSMSVGETRRVLLVSGPGYGGVQVWSRISETEWTDHFEK